MDFKNEDSIQVYIRVRPGRDEQTLVQYTPTQIHLDKNHFGFDKIFPPEATQQEIFYSVGTKLISHTLNGYNGCVFVYGQTGSGKTHTMIGEGNGLMQRSFTYLFQQIELLPKSQCIICCSYYQIYNQQIIDLLDTKKDKKLNIRTDIKKGVFVENLIEERVCNQAKLLECLVTGMKNRHVGETMMNRQSSRSHSIFTINFQIRSDVNGIQVLKTPKLHFVDLAGSQRQRMTAASGDRLKQAGSINKSLTTLGMVINALAGDKLRTHIPYRDSKLTCLLRDSLGGNSKTFLIATISRNVLCFQETLSTLNFANRAKMVKVKALVNQESLFTNIQTYKQEIKRLKSQIARLKSEKRSPIPNQLVQPSRKENGDNLSYNMQFRQLNEKINMISEQLVNSSLCLSPSLDNLIERIKNLRDSQCGDHLMEDQNQDQKEQRERESPVIVMAAEQEDPLIQYLSCNNGLLQKIHTKMDEYVELKQQLRNLAHREQLRIAQLKTPSKLQRDQYEKTIEKKEKQIEQQLCQIRQLRNLIAAQQLEIEQITVRAPIKNQENNEKYEQEQMQLRREVNALRNLMKQTNDQMDILSIKHQQALGLAQQNKELYLFAQQNYQSQKNLRDQIENNLMQKICEVEQARVEFAEKLLEQQQYFQQMEEGLKSQINVLAQSVEFGQGLILDYRTKLQTQKQKSKQQEMEISSLSLQLQQTQQLEREVRRELGSTSQVVSQTKIQLAVLKQTYEQQIVSHMRAYESLNQQYKIAIAKAVSDCTTYETMIKTLNQQLQNFKNTVINLQDKIKSLKIEWDQRVQDLQQKNQQNISEIIEAHQQKINDYQNLLANNFHNTKNIEEKMCMAQKQLCWTREQLKDSQQANAKIQQECSFKIQKMLKETKSKIERAHILEIQNEELKKQYKIMQKQNYKIKAKHSQNNSKSQQELALKVDYYEEKFKLMSIEYQKAMEVVKKLKQRQIDLAQKIVTLEETNKAIKISYQNEDSSEGGSILRSLSSENNQLKKELQLLKGQSLKQQSTQSYTNKMFMQQQKTYLKQKQQYFKAKIQESINRWDPSKENTNKTRNLEELIHCWEELEAESCKKLEAITKGIKKQQKIKIQNNLIMKENIYLKQQINNLEKQIGESVMGRPRKMTKVDMMRISEDILQ